MSRPNLAETAALIGDASRAAMLLSLFSGRALPASELARLAKITPQTASSHLVKLVEGGLLSAQTHGRHRYYKLASPEVAQALEALNMIAPQIPVRSLRESNESRDLRFARTCYDHLAGEVGVALADGLVELNLIVPYEKNYTVTDRGVAKFHEIGINIHEVKQMRRQFARQCLDWSERRPHVAGALGCALVNRFIELNWIVPIKGIRAVQVTSRGREGLESAFGVSLVN